MRAECAPDLRGQRGDRGVQVVDVVEDFATHGGVVRSEVPTQRFFELGDLGAHPTLGHLGEDRGVSLARDHRLNDLLGRL